MTPEKKIQLKLKIEKLIGRRITDAELNKVVEAYLRSRQSGETRLVESLSESTNFSNTEIQIKIAASNDADRVASDLISLLDKEK
tara:strand:+ start:78 stop:332 length:255 start_codon:yes stop_codon:yes gene_type:complete